MHFPLRGKEGKEGTGRRRGKEGRGGREGKQTN